MALNQALLRKKNTTRKSDYIPLGIHDATVKDVRPAPGYKLGEAVEIVYSVHCGNSIREYSEIFVNDPKNSRTAEFDVYLTEHNVTSDDWTMLTGLEEKLEFGKEIKNGRTFVNIVNREFVSYTQEETA